MCKRLILALVVVFASVGLVAVGQVTTWFHQSVTTPAGASGTIDWTAGWIKVTGYGVPGSHASTEAQGKLLARDAAIADAQWRLLEIINGVHVSGAATVLDHMASTAVRTGVEESIKRFQITEESWNVPTKRFLFFFTRQGNWREGEYQITIIYNLQELLLTFYPKGSEIYGGGEETTEAIEPTKYTGIVIDARGQGIQPSLYIKLVDSQSNPVAEAVAISYVPSAGYRLSIPDMSVEKAKNDPRVGDNPLEIKAQGITEMGYTLVISQTDAKLIQQMAATSDILTRGGGSVLVVAD